MIAAYAQASGRQGLDAAVDGRIATLGDARFAALREKGAALNLKTKRALTPNVDVQYGQGVVRLELPGSEDDAATRSPIVVVLEVAELSADRGALLRRVAETIAAIGRQCDAVEINAGIDAGERINRAGRTRTKIGVASAVVIVLLAIVVVLARRTL